MSEEPTATVREIDGQLVLDDPLADAVWRACGKINCGQTLQANADRVAHFARRVGELGLSSSDVMIAILNADDVHGGPLAEALMPGFDWQAIRDRGEVPFARGLVMRDGVTAAVEIFDRAAAEKLRGMEGLAVLVVDHGVAEAYPAERKP